MFIGGDKLRGLTRAEAVCELGKSEAVTQEPVLDLSVINRRESVENGFNLPNAVMNDVPCEGDVANWSSEQHKATLGGAGDTPFERVVDRRGGAASNQGFKRVERETDFPPL